ncbi:MAG: class I SAM-dependent methyltransferase [Kofleriaceae bacterium]
MIICFLLVAVLLLDANRMRGRVGKLATLAPSSEDYHVGYTVFAAPGVVPAVETVRAAAAYAREHEIELLDLIPKNLGAMRALAFAQLVDPSEYRADRIGPGRTAGHAILVANSVVDRSRAEHPTDDISFAKLAANLKHYGKADAVIAPLERAKAQPMDQRYQLLYVVLGPSTPIALGMLVVMWALIGLGIWLAPIAGFAALAAWQLQPVIALAGTALVPRDLIPFTLFRVPIELYTLVGTLLGTRPSAKEAAEKRPEYARLVADGLEKFYEPRRETCPVCDSKDLKLHLRHGDMFQHKPGTFRLDRCTACNHIFQNPRLSIAGLDFYYKDFYDGLGEAGMEFIFGFGKQPYLDRLAMVRAVTPPTRWLDVGAGHGHFCVAARAELPDAKFDGLDLSESIDEAKRRGWVDTSYRGLFPELAPQMAGQYDAVSMSHYLEHTIDQRAEIAAAYTALAPGGCLMIEVPDPEFWIGRLLRRYWLPWFQPQHLHFVSVANLGKLLEAQGFKPVEWHRGKAHQRVDFFFATWLFLDRIAPPRKLPWRWRGVLAGAWRSIIWTIGAPFILLAIAFDNAIGPLFARAKISNTYRVVAKKA